MNLVEDVVGFEDVGGRKCVGFEKVVNGGRVSVKRFDDVCSHLWCLLVATLRQVYSMVDCVLCMKQNNDGCRSTITIES